MKIKLILSMLMLMFCFGTSQAETPKDMILRQHDENLRVVRVQLQLLDLGIYNGLVHGQYDQRTEESVKVFQRNKGLAADGLAGPMTMGVLDKVTENSLFLLFLHTTASKECQYFTGEQVGLMHTLPISKKGRGWSRPGYSDVIRLDGIVDNIRDWDSDDNINEREYTFGVLGTTLLNRNARHVCYVGGLDKDGKTTKDTRTPHQLAAMETYVKFNLLRKRNLVIAGHNQVQIKDCPCFDVPDWCRSIGIPEKNIAQWGKMYK